MPKRRGEKAACGSERTALLFFKKKIKSNKKTNVKYQIQLLSWNSHRHQKANSNYENWGVKLPKLCRHRDRKQGCDSSVHTQCKLYRAHVNIYSIIPHVHHSCQACQIERGQVFFFQNDVLTQFLVSTSHKSACTLPHLLLLYFVAAVIYIFLI